MRLLFVDLDYHLRTKSADFFLDILRSGFEVETHYYSSLYHANIPKEKLDRADAVVIWESVLGRRDFAIPGKPCVYVPMYDGDWGSLAQWHRIARSGCHVISFSNEITRMARRGGVPAGHLLEVRYAYDPADFSDAAGDPGIAAIWERGYFGFEDFKRLFAPGFFRKVVVHRRPQPGLTFAPISAGDREAYRVELDESEFLPKAEYLKLSREAGVYLAPRPKEGIGMAFLEQLAMGKCVIVHDDGTMNEYVRDGVNGIVRDLHRRPRPVTAAEIAAARSGVRAEAERQFARWREDRRKIVPFVDAAAKAPPVRIGGFADGCWRAAYLAEAAADRLCRKLNFRS